MANALGKGKVHFCLIVLVSLLIAACSQKQPETTASTPSSVSASIIDKFKKPDVDARPMARMWLPDAGAGADQEGLALVAKQINDMAKGGFGGAEIAYLSDSTSYTNAEAKTIGWGSENWRRILKQALKTANAVKDGFKIDITITSHWPPVVNNVDPNDDEASQETAYAFKKIPTNDLAAGTMDLPLPAQKTKDYFSPMGGGEDAKADFLFVDKFIAATVTKVVRVNSDGSPVFALNALTDASGATAKKKFSAEQSAKNVAYKEVDGVRYAGYAAGIPDKAYAEAHGLDYGKAVVGKFGPEPASDNFAGKIDSENSRRRMADWQYLHQTNLNAIDSLKGYKPSGGDALAAGDCALIGTYYRGTGQVMSGGSSITIYNRSYATDYFSEKGIGKVFEFWNKHILDEEMLALLKENGSKNGTSIFEDSIEIHAESPMWTGNLLEEFKKFNGYDAAKYAPVIAMLASRPEGIPGMGGGGPVSSSPSFDESSEAGRIKEDYNLLLGNLYATKHAASVSKWAASFNYTYRAQGYSLTGLDIAGAAAALDVPEGDNSSSGDGVRNLVAAVHVKGGKMMSMESTTFSVNLSSTWATVLKELNRDYSHGINRSILHGSAFARTFNRYNSSWPGWNFWNFSSWNARQIHFDDVDTFSGYVARTQTLFQNGKPKVDLAILLGTEASFNIQSGNSMQTLLDKGYSYDLLSEALLKLNSAKAENGVLCPSGPAYKAIIAREARIFSAKTIQSLIEYAKNGLPIILYNCDIQRVYGTNRSDNNDTLLAKNLAELMKLSTVKTVKTQDEILTILSGLGVIPAASYTASGLEASGREASEGNYYYLFNNSNNRLETDVALKGKGAPYLLNAWTGEIIPLGCYNSSDGGVRANIKLEPKEAAIVAIAGDTAEFPKVKNVYVTSVNGGEAVYDQGNIVHRAEKFGTYSISFSDKTQKTITADKMPENVGLAGGWSLKLESWGPDPDGNRVDPTLSAKKTISFEGIPLSAWPKLPATNRQLTTLGVKSMSHVSGIGYYSKTFVLPSDWNQNMGAYLRFEHGSDMITEVTINDSRIDNVNQLTNTVDVGPYLKSGSNSLAVKLDTTLKNRIDAEGGGSSGPGGGIGTGVPGGARRGGADARGAARAGRGGGGGMPPTGRAGAPPAAPGGAPAGMPPSGRTQGAPAAAPAQPMGGQMPGMEASSDQESEDYGLTGIGFIPYIETVLVQ
jgi:hypothetical protein